MKPVNWIITFYLLFLSLAPVLELTGLLSEVFCCKETNLTSTDVVADHKSEDKDCATGCNHFISCHCCVGFTIPEGKTFFRSAINLKVESTTEKIFRVIRYIHTIWHPPKILLSFC